MCLATGSVVLVQDQGIPNGHDIDELRSLPVYQLSLLRLLLGGPGTLPPESFLSTTHGTQLGGLNYGPTSGVIHAML